jgi:hypothetical protein
MHAVHVSHALAICPVHPILLHVTALTTLVGLYKSETSSLRNNRKLPVKSGGKIESIEHTSSQILSTEAQNPLTVLLWFQHTESCFTTRSKIHEQRITIAKVITTHSNKQEVLGRSDSRTFPT